MLSRWLVATRPSPRNLGHAHISNSYEGFSRGRWGTQETTQRRQTELCTDVQPRIETRDTSYRVATLISYQNMNLQTTNILQMFPPMSEFDTRLPLSSQASYRLY
jgi:hypothetical protein